MDNNLVVIGVVALVGVILGVVLVLRRNHRDLKDLKGEGDRPGRNWKAR